MTEQAVYWKHLHPIKDIHDSVYDRYKSEAHRTWDVLEKRLTEQGDYICGHHFTIVGKEQSLMSQAISNHTIQTALSFHVSS